MLYSLLQRVAKRTTSKEIIPKPATGYDPEPVASVSHPYNLPPKVSKHGTLYGGVLLFYALLQAT